MKRLSTFLLVGLLLAVVAAPINALYYEQVALRANATSTNSGSGAGVDLVKAIFSTDNRHKGTFLAVYLDVWGVSGSSPTLDVKIQCSPDNSQWFDPASTTANRDSYAFAQKTALSKDMKI